MVTVRRARRRKPATDRTVVEEQRQVLRALQQTIQAPGVTAQICGLRVWVRCTSAEPDLDIGSAWYLVMPLPDGDLLLAVGDSTGHGLPAATAMVRLRFAMV